MKTSLIMLSSLCILTSLLAGCSPNQAGDKHAEIDATITSTPDESSTNGDGVIDDQINDPVDPENRLIIPADEDTYLWSKNPSNVYGDETMLSLNGSESIVLLRFPTIDIPQGKWLWAATLSLTIHPDSQAGGQQFYIGVANPGSPWTEAIASWTTRPQYFLELSVRKEILTDNAAGLTEIDIIEYFKTAWVENWPYLDLMLSAPDWGGLQQVWYASEYEDASLHPVLIIELRE